MSNKRILFGVLSASVVAAIAPSTASAANLGQAAVEDLPMSVDPYGRVTLASQDIGTLIGTDDAEMLEMYAGNNCSCVNNRQCGSQL